MRKASAQEVRGSDLYGSFKQVRWAIGLRREFLGSASEAERPAVERILEARKEASWWIDHRRLPVSELIEAFEKEKADVFYRPRRGDDCDPALGMILDCTGESNW